MDQPLARGSTSRWIPVFESSIPSFVFLDVALEHQRLATSVGIAELLNRLVVLVAKRRPLLDADHHPTHHL